MSQTVSTLLAAAEALSPAERRELVDLLAVGLDDAPAGRETPTLSDAWRREVAARSAEFDAGRAGTVPWEEVLGRWQARRAADG